MEKKLKIDFAKSISEFERAMKEFKVKRVMYRSLFRGKGLEFNGYRVFGQDEDASLIDWKSSLRANKYLAKEYIEERDSDIYFVIDVSNSMLFGSKDKLKAEYAVETIAAISRLVLSSGDRVGLILFNRDIVKFLPPSNSKNQFFMIIDCLSRLDNYSDGFNFNGLIDFLFKRIKNKSSVIVIVSDFLHMSKGFDRKLNLLSTKFETFGIMIRDNFDESIQGFPHQIVIKDPHSNRQILVDPSIAAKQYSAIALKQKIFIKDSFKRLDVDLLELKTDKPFVLPLVSFLEKRSGGRLA